MTIKIPKWLLAVVLWALLGLPGVGMALADSEHKFRLASSCRSNAAFAYGWGLTSGPVGSAIALFTTGFAENGFQYQCYR